MSKFWNFIKNEATDTTPESIELRIQGIIVNNDDAWIYEWLDMDCANPNTFREELNNYKGKDITVWVDSDGGDVFAAAGIYDALKEHDGKITMKITKAISAASVIAMAADEVLMSPVGIMMIHNPLSAIRGYASDMRKQADVLDVVKETIMNAYTNKSNKTQDEISAMMDDETYMSANVAVKEGFADGILHQENTSAPENIMNFAFNRLSIQNCANESFKQLLEIENKNRNKNKIIPKEANEMDIKNVTELKNQLPDVHNEVYNSGNTEGVKAERERLKAFDMLNGKVDSVFLDEEKYKDGATAESVLFKAMQEGKMINSAYMDQIKIDAENANKVPGAASDNNQADEVTGILNFVKNTAEKTLGRGGL